MTGVKAVFDICRHLVWIELSVFPRVLGDTEEELCDGYELGKLCQIKGVCREPREPLKPVTRRGKKNLLDSLKIG